MFASEEEQRAYCRRYGLSYANLEKKARDYCRENGVSYNGQLMILMTRELKPLPLTERDKVRRQIYSGDKRSLPIEEPLPEGASLTNPLIMNLVFRTLIASGVIR